MAPSATQLLIILAIVLLIFGGKRIASLGKDMGSAVRGFKSAVKDGEDEVRDEAKADAAAKTESSDKV